MSRLGLETIRPKGKLPKQAAGLFNVGEWREIAAARNRGVSFEQIHKATKRAKSPKQLQGAFYRAVKLYGLKGSKSEAARSRSKPGPKPGYVSTTRNPWWATVTTPPKGEKWKCPDCGFESASSNALWWHHTHSCGKPAKAKGARSHRRFIAKQKLGEVASATVAAIRSKARKHTGGHPVSPWWDKVTDEQTCPDCGKHAKNRKALWQHHYVMCAYGPQVKPKPRGARVRARGRNGKAGGVLVDAATKRRAVRIHPGDPVSREDARVLEGVIAKGR